jgi:iron complex transport system substrate-binding protein
MTLTSAPARLQLDIDDDATRRRFLQLVGSIPLLAAAGCSSDDEAEPAPSAAATRTVTDKAGRTVEIPAQPSRVVVLDFGPIIASLVELELIPIGATSNEQTTDFSERFGPSANAILDVGDTNAVNLEKVAALKPDLILTNTVYIDVDIEALQRIAPTVGFEGPNRYLDILQFHADIVGRRERADELAAEFNDDLMRSPARQALAGRKVALASFREDTFTLFGPELQFGLLIEALSGEVYPGEVGGKPLTDFSEDLSLEVVPELLDGADFVVLLRDFAGADSDEEIESVLDSPLWQRIPAVERGDVRVVDIQAMVGTAGFAGLRRAVDQLGDGAPAATETPSSSPTS